MSEEEYLHEMLAILHRQYLKDAQPYLDRLAGIATMRPHPPIYMTLPDAARAAIKAVEGETK